MNTPEGPLGRDPAIRMIARPADANPSGDIFGGYIMSLMDMAGASVAFQRAGGRIATVAVKEITFLAPVQVGDEVSCYAELRGIGRTSIAVFVEVWTRRRTGGHPIKVTEGEFTYVRIDRSGQSTPVAGR